MKLDILKKKLKGFGNIQNMYVPNQFIVNFDNGSVFQSYDSIIAIEIRTSKGRKIYLGKDWDYSVTTGKYRNNFLGENKKETEAKIKSGEYKLLEY